MTNSPYLDLLERLRAVRAKENRVAVLYGTLAAGALTLLLILAVVILEQLFTFGTLGRTLLASGAAVGCVALWAWLTGPPLLRTIGLLASDDDLAVARRVGAHFPGIRDRLLDALQLYQEREALQEKYSPALIDASFADLYENIRPLAFTASVSTARLRPVRTAVLSAAGLFLLALLLSPSGFLSSANRLLHYGEAFAAPKTIEFVVEPGNAEIVRGESVTITVHTLGSPVSALSLLTRQHGQMEFDTQLLKLSDGGVFKTVLANMKGTTEYSVSAEKVTSPTFTITVLDRPLIRALQLKIVSPAYTRIPPKIPEENIGDISAYPGSAVTVLLGASKELSAASLLFHDSTVVRLSAKGSNASGQFTVRKNGSYHLLLKDRDGLPNLDPVEYTVKVIPDEYPTAAILSPARNLDLTGEMKLELFLRVKDDFGFSRLRLLYRLAASKYEKPADEFTALEIPLGRKDLSPLDLPFHWDLAPLNLVPEDAIAYAVEVFDNDNVSGPKSGRSETYLVRLPSLEEVFSDVAENHQQSMESMKDVAKETEQMKKDIDEMQREMKKSTMDWQQQKKSEQMAQRYEQMKKKLEEASRKLDETVKKMEENKLLSNETLEKYMELQKLMEQLNSPELQEALKKLQQSMKQPSPEQMKQAMEQLKFSEEQFRSSLERTIELLKRIHIEQKLDELVKRAEELAREQKAVKEQSAKSGEEKRNEMAKRQSDLEQQASSMEKEAAALQKKMEEFPKEMPVDEMAKAQDAFQKKQTGSKMQKAAQKMQAGEMNSAGKDQQEAEEDLKEFAEDMKQVQKSLQEKQQKQVINQMRKQVQNMVELSKRQESLKEETKSLDPNSQRFRENAEAQNEVLSDLGNVANAVGELGKKTFAISPDMGREIGNAMRQMNQAMEDMENRNPGGSSQKQGEAMSSLNLAAMMMQNALNGMLQGGQGGSGMAGLMGRLGQMAGQQSGINSGTQQAMGSGQGQPMSADQQAAYQRLAGQQAAVQKSLEQLSQEAKNTGEFSKMLGDLDRIAQEMREVQTDLVQGNVNPATLQKQERILSRMLDSQRSMHERDYEKRRKAEAGKAQERTSPADIDLTTQEGKNKLRDELLKVLEGKYAKDYELLIKRYFEQLQKEEVKE
jgi:hypothetical protein